MKRIFNAFLLLSAIVIIIIAGFFTLINLNAHNGYVDKIIDHKDFRKYIIVREDIDDLEFSPYLIYVSKGDKQFGSPIEKSGVQKGDLVWPYYIEVKVNEEFAKLNKEEQFKILQEITETLREEIIGIGFLHKGYYQELSFYYFDEQQAQYDAPYTHLNMEVYEPNEINGMTLEEWMSNE